MQAFGIYWFGVNAESGRKLFYSLAVVTAVVAGSSFSRWLVRLTLRRVSQTSVRAQFWTRQAISLFSMAFLILGLMSIWFTDPARLATAFGLVSAGLAFALQQVITSVAGYFVILRGSTFNVGDRISMGGVRGDVLRLGFIQTTIMEMGQPPSMQGGGNTIWVQSRQFTGRIVTVTNSKIFDEPVYNYTRDFPYIWEEMAIPITYSADRAKAEAILLAAARAHAVDSDSINAAAKARLHDQFAVEPIDLEPRVYYRITDNWLELSVRFLLTTHQTRIAKDAMSRQIISELDKVGIGIASSTYDIVGMPKLDVRLTPS